MSKKLMKKAGLMFAIEAACLILLGVFLTFVQTHLSVEHQKNDMAEKMGQMDELIEFADKESLDTKRSFDAFYQSKAESMAFAISEGIDKEFTNYKLKEYKELLNVNNVLILDEKGKVLAAAQKSPVDFTYDRFNQLRSVFKTKQVSDAFEVKTGGQCYRYYGAPVDSNRMVVIEQSPVELNQLLDSISTWDSILSNVSLGQNGYAFALSNRDYTFLYHPDEGMIGQDGLEKGISVGNLEDGKFTWMTINGEKMYCGVKEAEDAYLIFAVSEAEIIASRDMTVGIILFVFFAVMTVVITYAIFTMSEEEERDTEESVEGAGKYIYNRTIGKKIGAISVVGLILILIISMYMQTLFSLSRQSLSSRQRVEEVQSTIMKNQEDIQMITEQYNTRYLNKCRFAAYVLGKKPELRNKKDLERLSDILAVDSVNVFDSEGKEIATNAMRRNFKLSDNPEDQSYAFNVMLNGAEYFIQEAQPDEASGAYCQYIAVTLVDKNDDMDGFVQIGVGAESLQNMLKTTEITAVLNGVRVGVNGFAFAVNKSDHTFAYYPEERLIGRSVLEYGIEEKQLQDGYTDYMTVAGKRYYTSSLETEGNYIYVAIPEEEISGQQAPVTIATVGISFICLLVICLMLAFKRRETAETNGANGLEESRMIDVKMPDGTKRRTESAASRWTNVSLKWWEKTPEQKVATILRGILTIMAVLICFAVVFKKQFFHEGSIMLYVLNGEWERGLNIFSITSCIMILCVVAVLTMFVRKVLQLLSNTFGARGETVCRLISSFVKYVSVVAVLYYCFALFGVDTATLLASAGILSLVIGLGAKTLVADIIAGLFIIFEGEFRVGDIVTIGDWRGTVIDIGVRTTKIEDGNKNIKIISNSSVSGVINMTRQYSFASCDVGIEYGESLERVETILQEEFPNIRRRLPAILDGPFYKGVVSLGDNSVNLRIVVQCKEDDRLQLLRDLNREIKLIFDRHRIGIPFPQIVLNQPTEFREATAWEKYRAEKFNEEQKEKTKELNDEIGK